MAELTCEISMDAIVFTIRSRTPLPAISLVLCMFVYLYDRRRHYGPTDFTHFLNLVYLPHAVGNLLSVNSGTRR